MVEAGITLHDLHAELAKYNLAMINVGSISDQTLGGIITTATHGSGFDYGVMSTQVRGLKILLANGQTIVCSRTQDSELFLATLCGIGATGIVLEILLDVEPAFRLREVQEPIMFEDMVRNIDVLTKSAQHVRFWWFPVTDKAICSSADRTYDVSLFVFPNHRCLTSSSSHPNQLEAGSGTLSLDTMSCKCCFSSDCTSHSSISGLNLWHFGS